MSSDATFERRGFVVVISGPSGVGKTVFCTHLLETRKDTVRLVTATTRDPRPGEQDGRDYFFIPDRAEFERRAAAGEFLEHAEVHGELYGTPRRFVEEQVAAGRIVLLNIDVQGGASIRKQHPDGVYVFLYPPSYEALLARLRSRRQDDEAEIARRLANAPGEMARWRDYDYVVVNEDLPQALAQVSSIVEAERHRASRLVPRQMEGSAAGGAPPKEAA
jgi:guanylate kinase